jgi:energy-coupling factor transporter ATP-binding protein EcfA2
MFGKQIIKFLFNLIIDKEDREAIYKQTKTIPPCFLCNTAHWRCKDKECTNCCSMEKCNDILCDNCKSQNIECKRCIPKDKEDYEKNFASKISYICGQYEHTESGKLHLQLYMQFTDRMTIAKSKEVLGDNSISIIEKLYGTSEQNKNYAMKMYNRCKEHSKCRCDFFDLTKICGNCNGSCVRTFARWGNGRLAEELVGPFEFGEFRVIERFKNSESSQKYEEQKAEEHEAIIEGNNMLIDGATPLEVFKHNKDKVRYSYSYESMKKIYQDLQKENEKERKIIPEKKFYPKNFLFYGDSGSGKSTIIENLASALVNGREYCVKAKDRKYIDEYDNHECVIHHELSHETWNFENLLSVTERDKCTIRQRNKKPIEMVQKYNAFTAQDIFDNIFSYRTRVFSSEQQINIEKRIALYRRFTQSIAYTHGYIIWLQGRFLDGRIRFTITSNTDSNNRPGNLQDFIDGRFDIKFFESMTIEEAKKYVYDDDIENLYEKDGDVYMKREVDMNFILGGIICDIVHEYSSFWVYNKYWTGDLPTDIYPPKNIEKLHQNLLQKLNLNDDLI